MKLDLENINIRRLLTNRKYLFVTIGFSLLGVIILLTSIFPQVSKIVEIQNDIDSQSQKLKQLQIKLSSLQDAQTLQLVENAQSIDHALPSYKPLLELMSGINYVARQSNISIEDIQLTPGIISEEEQNSDQVIKKTTQDLGGYKSLSVDLKISGNMSEINSFLSQLERISPLINVNKIALSEEKKLVDDFLNSDFEAELEIMTYYFTKTVKSAVNTPLPSVGQKEQELIDEIRSYFVADPNTKLNIEGGSTNLFGFETEYSLEEVN